MPNDTDFDNLDLDFEVNQDEDLFSEFHKAKKDGKESADVKTVTTTPNNTDEPPAGETEQEKALRLQIAKAANEKLETENLLQDFVDKSLSGIKVKKEDTDDAGKKNDAGKDEGKETVFEILYKSNVEKGIWKPVKDFDGTEEAYFEAQRLNDEDRIQQGLGQLTAEMFEENPDKANAELALDFLRHLSIGGNPKDYINVISKTEIGEDELESDDALVKENAQRKVFFEYWKEQGLTEAAVTKKYTNAKLKDVLDDEVETIYPLLKAKRDLEKRELVAKTTSAKIKNESTIQSFNRSLIKSVEESKDIYGLPLTEDKIERSELLNYMFKNSVKLPNSEKLAPQFLVDREDLGKDPNWVLFQAIAARQIKTTGKLDFKILEKQIEKKKVNTLSDKLTELMQGSKKEIKNSDSDDADFSNVPDLDFANL